MKRCPQCNRVESDDALAFCRVDGATLISDASISSDSGTESVGSASVSSEIETSILPHLTDASSSASGGATTVFESQRTSPGTRKLSKAHRRPTVLLVVGFVVLALAVLVYFVFVEKNTTAIDSIAVLPFVNQNRDPDTEYLSDGLTESIINSLTQLPLLRVSPRSSVFQYKGKDIDPLQASRDLGVRAVVTGRLLQRGDNLMVSVELLDVRNNKQVWGEQYNRKVADALAVQQEISREISERLRTKLTGEEQNQLARRDTSSPEAYGFYLRGRYYWNKRTADNVRKAMEQFQQAADKDPNYALAYVGLADCYAVLGEYAGTVASDTVPKAKGFAERALQLDGSLAEAHTTLAFVYDQLWQWEKAEEEFKLSIKLNPNYPTAHHWYSLFLAEMGRFDQALTEAKRAQELDPISAIIGNNLATNYLAHGDVNSSIDQSKRVLDLDATFPRSHDSLALAYIKVGRFSEAIAELEKAFGLSANDRLIPRDLGYSYAISGKRAEALVMLKRIEDNYEKNKAYGQDVAAVYVGLGEKEQAFAWLEKDFQTNNSRLARIRFNVPFESLRSDPRFADLLRRMGVPQ